MEEDPKLRDTALAANDGKGTGMKRRLFIALVRQIWMTGEIPRQLWWIIVVLLPKGGGGYRGIGLMEPILKVIEGIMDQRLSVIEFHDCLHGYLPKRGTGTAIMESKLAQQLAYLEQHPLYVVFIDLRKAFDATMKDPAFLADLKKQDLPNDPANAQEALREARLDTAEGADFLMVKPALNYLDIIALLKYESELPIAAYHVSGECAMLLAACGNGWLDYEQAMPETLLSIHRAGADVIITYFAKDYAQRVYDGRLKY